MAFLRLCSVQILARELDRLLPGLLLHFISFCGLLIFDAQSIIQQSKNREIGFVVFNRCSLSSIPLFPPRSFRSISRLMIAFCLKTLALFPRSLHDSQSRLTVENGYFGPCPVFTGALRREQSTRLQAISFSSLIAGDKDY